MPDFGVAVDAAAVTAAGAAVARMVAEVAAAARDTSAAGSWSVRAIRRLRGEHPGDARLQVLYWEVLFNAFILREGQGFRPPALLVTTTEWERPGTADSVARLSPADISVVVGAYAPLAMYRWSFGGSYMALFADRVSGNDQRALANLADMFVKAEAALRPRAFSSRDLPAITKAIEEDFRLAEPVPRSGPVARVHGAMIGGRNTEQVLYASIIVGLPMILAWRLSVAARWLWQRWRSPSPLS